MKIRFLEVAETDWTTPLISTTESPGLGDRFLEILDVLNRVARFRPPGIPARNERDDAAKTLPVWSDLSARGDEILVVAVANLHREPEYWEDRLQK